MKFLRMQLAHDLTQLPTESRLGRRPGIKKRDGMLRDSERG